MKQQNLGLGYNVSSGMIADNAPINPQMLFIVSFFCKIARKGDNG